MSVLEYFLVPELILDFGICLVCVLYIKKDALEKMKGQIEFGPITKETLLEMTPSIKKQIVKSVIIYSIIALLITSAIGAAFTKWVEPTLLTFFISLAAESAVTVLFFVPLFKRMKKMV